MFQLNDDLSIYVTRGDTAFFGVTAADENGNPYLFKAGDVVRIKVYTKKDAADVLLQKDFPVEVESETVSILLTEQETRLGGTISKPTDYWYEVELNPNTEPQTIIGYDEDGAKILRLYPEGEEIEEEETDPADIPVVDEALDMTSPRPVENRAIAAEIVRMNAEIESLWKAVRKLQGVSE